MTKHLNRIALRARRDLAKVCRGAFFGSSHGNAAAEFAIMFPVMITVMFGIIQFGSVLYVMNNMQNAARDAAREYAVGKITTAGAAQTYAQNLLAGWGLTFNVVVKSAYSLGPTDRDVKVTITVPAAQAALVGFPPLWGASNLTAYANFRKEG